ncbi:MAG: hypothetical protein JNJ41_02515 [Bacteroidia bacterium]|nr:hypothetical protein [Bacteroidia bacterium]
MKNDLLHIKMCRECKASLHKKIKNAKNAIIENEINRPSSIDKTNDGILNDYVFKNVIKKPEHFGNIARMAIQISSQWQNGRTLTASFMGGSKVVQERVKRHALIWMDHVNIELDFKSRKKPADIRITFDKNDGSWSYVGTELLGIDSGDPTMNLGWLTPTTDDEEYHRVVLHEFGHTLGCIHEHSNPIGKIPWDKTKAYKYYQETQGWSKEEVDEQVFAKYDKDLIRGSKIDKKSIMMYPIPNEITIGDYEIGWNNDLSEGDKKFMAKMYPKK